MYSVDEKDRVIEITALPQSSVGSPLPMIVSDEHNTYLAYLIDDLPGDWDGTNPRGISISSTGESIAIVRIFRSRAHSFGPPNDEAFAGHPLASRGLKPYGQYEVLNSSWIRSLERMNRVHSRHDPARFAALRHFVLSFHDSTFECVAQEIELVEKLDGSMRDAATRMVELTAQG